MTETKHKTRSFADSVYTKTIGIDPVDLDYIDKTRGKKSKAGRLKEIIGFYIKYNDKKYEN